jgi:hypothetical protein
MEPKTVTAATRANDQAVAATDLQREYETAEQPPIQYQRQGPPMVSRDPNGNTVYWGGLCKNAYCDP